MMPLAAGTARGGQPASKAIDGPDVPRRADDGPVDTSPPCPACGVPTRRLDPIGGVDGPAVVECEAGHQTSPAAGHVAPAEIPFRLDGAVFRPDTISGATYGMAVRSDPVEDLLRWNQAMNSRPPFGAA